MKLLDLIYPPRCAFCHRFVNNSKIRVCTDCEKSLPFIQDGAVQKPRFIAAAAAVFRYENDVKNSLHRYKFAGCTGYARAYAPFLAETIRREFGDEYDVLTWVPISRKRLHKRGYDQAELLARAVGAILGVKPVRTLDKIRDNPPQSRAGNEEKRRANVAGVYRVHCPERVAGKRILLLDDIYTTGSTVSECARMLGLAGADKVLCAAVARAGGG